MALFNTVKLFGVPIFTGSFQEAFVVITRALENKTSRVSCGVYIVYTPNTEHVMLAQRHPQFLHALQSADLALPDGIGVVWASNMLSSSRKESGGAKERITGREMMFSLIEYCAHHHLRVFLLGGREQVAQKTAEYFRGRFSDLEIAYDEGANMVAQETFEENTRTLSAIQKFQPELLCVAYGAPHQELWIEHHRDELSRARVRVAMGVGGSFDIFSGRLSLPSTYVERIGLEWLWRLLQEPWRWKRQTVLVQFWIKVWIKKIFG